MRMHVVSPEELTHRSSFKCRRRTRNEGIYVDREVLFLGLREGMALVVVCGQPCSGKSTASGCLANALETDSRCVAVIDEPSLNLDRNQSYKDMPSEKNLRGVIRSAVDRALSKDTVVILDSLNNIKGYRYELWCLARAAGLQYCVVRSLNVLETGYVLAALHCDAGDVVCRAWNKARQEADQPSYSDHIFDDLVCRFERPDNRNRWDSPLFELKPELAPIEDSSQGLVDISSFLRGRGGHGARGGHRLQPTIATQNVRVSETNSLYELNRATQEVITTLFESQTEGLGGGAKTLCLGKGLPIISLDRSVGLPELRRHRRTFLKLAGQSGLSGPPPPSDFESARRMFADYLCQELSSR